MFLPRISRPSCALAWLAASQAVHGLTKHEGYHVVIDVEDPVSLSPLDAAVVRELDNFLTRHNDNAFLVRTVANTIFPQATYETHGSPDFYEIYTKRVFPRLKRSPRDWGRYFERMTAYPGPDGPVNLLADLVADMRRHVGGDRTFRNIYELPIFNPMKDRVGSPIGRQCLSYMSFKLDSENRVLLSAVYRNHFYTEKLLGNLIGLGRLLAFVAAEVGIAVGALSVLSTHAHVDAAGGSQDELRTLHKRCADILAGPENAQAA